MLAHTGGWGHTSECYKNGSIIPQCTREVNYDGPESFHYHDDDFQVAKGMTKAFNQICSEEGVEVLYTMNPSTFQAMYSIKNVCDKMVQVLYDQTFQLLEPGESCIVQVTTHSLYPARPYIVKVLNNGV